MAIDIACQVTARSEREKKSLNKDDDLMKGNTKVVGTEDRRQQLLHLTIMSECAIKCLLSSIKTLQKEVG